LRSSGSKTSTQYRMGIVFIGYVPETMFSLWLNNLSTSSGLNPISLSRKNRYSWSVLLIKKLAHLDLPWVIKEEFAWVRRPCGIPFLTKSLPRLNKLIVVFSFTIPPWQGSAIIIPILYNQSFVYYSILLWKCICCCWSCCRKYSTRT